MKLFQAEASWFFLFFLTEWMGDSSFICARDFAFFSISVLRDLPADYRGRVPAFGRWLGTG